MEVLVTNPEQPIPLPADLEAWEEWREQLEEDIQQSPAHCQATAVPPVLLLPTMADAQRALKRVRYFRQKAAEVVAVFGAEIDRLQEEIRRVQAAGEEALRPWRRRESWYLMALEQFARAENAADPKVKTVKLPDGELALRAQQPEWNYDDEQALGQWLLQNAPQFVKPAPVKTDLKKATKVREDGTVMLVDSGEILPGVKVTERPAAFAIKLPEEVRK